MKQTDTHLFFARSYLSNWYSSPFRHAGQDFSCVEQGMMWCKANLFKDTETGNKILADGRPWKQKQLGRLVKNFDSGIWDINKENLVFNCCYAKFNQNLILKDKLLSTAPLTLAEASPWDKVWGVGLSEDNPLIIDPINWTGLNLLGQVLMKVREELNK